MQRMLPLLLAIGTFPCSSTLGREILVNNLTGSDDPVGNAAAPDGGYGPVQTINRALCLAQPGDRIVIAKTPEPYREQIAISGSRLRGNSLRPLVITSDGAVLDGTVSAASGAWTHYQDDVFFFRPTRLAYQQLFLNGKPLKHVELTSIRGGGQGLNPLEWALIDGAILFRTDPSRLPDSYGLRHSGLQTGITLYNAKKVVIEGLVIQGFQQDGVNAHELVQDCTLRNLDCRANGRSGLSVGGASEVRAEACHFYDNGRFQVRTDSVGQLSLIDCDVEDLAESPAYQDNSGRLLVNENPVTP